MDADSGEMGMSQNGVVGAEGSVRKYRMNSDASDSASTGVPHSFRACAGYRYAMSYKFQCFDNGWTLRSP